MNYRTQKPKEKEFLR